MIVERLKSGPAPLTRLEPPSLDRSRYYSTILTTWHVNITPLASSSPRLTHVLGTAAKPPDIRQTATATDHSPCCSYPTLYPVASASLYTSQPSTSVRDYCTIRCGNCRHRCRVYRGNGDTWFNKGWCNQIMTSSMPALQTTIKYPCERHGHQRRRTQTTPPAISLLVRGRHMRSTGSIGQTHVVQ